MSSLLSSVGIDRLTVAERIQLVPEIWDSIAAEVEQHPLTQAQRDELDRRLAPLQTDRSKVVPWKEVEARALARFRR
jgi:putative addiction module component (TIGR02574 family)